MNFQYDYDLMPGRLKHMKGFHNDYLSDKDFNSEAAAFIGRFNVDVRHCLWW